jgi:hypothetical protein
MQKVKTIIRFLFFHFFLGLTISAFPQKSIQKMCLEVLEGNKIDSVVIFNSSNKKDGYAKTFLTYLGTANTTDNRSFKIITYKFVWGPNRHTSGSIYIFNDKDQYMGMYHLGGASDLPAQLKNNNLIFTNDDDDSCDKNLITTISLRKGLPEKIFIKCQGIYGDLYYFSSDD